MRRQTSRQFCFAKRQGFLWSSRAAYLVIMWNEGGGYQSMDSSFGGGGYMQDNRGFTSPTDSQEKKRGGGSRTQSVLPCSIKQLREATYNQATDVFSIGPIDLNQVTIIGIIREAQESATNITYKINDMTSDDIVVRKWIDNEENETEKERRSACRENTYVRVVGHMKSFQDNRSVVAFSLMPVTDFNEITYHMLDTIYSHLALTKQPDMMDAGMAAGPTSMATPGKMNASFGGGGAGVNLGLSGIQRQVHDIIASCNLEQGMGFSGLRQKIRTASEAQIRSAVEFLSNEGHIYTTIDEDHYRSTDSGCN